MNKPKEQLQLQIIIQTHTDLDLMTMKQKPVLRSGEIHVIVGPMFAGKTTTLLRRIKSEATNGR